MLHTLHQNSMTEWQMPSAGGESGFQDTGMIEWGKNQNPKKIPGPNFNPKEIPC